MLFCEGRKKEERLKRMRETNLNPRAVDGGIGFNFNNNSTCVQFQFQTWASSSSSSLDFPNSMFSETSSERERFKRRLNLLTPLFLQIKVDTFTHYKFWTLFSSTQSQVPRIHSTCPIFYVGQFYLYTHCQS